jgi:hypothetical protein
MKGRIHARRYRLLPADSRANRAPGHRKHPLNSFADILAGDALPDLVDNSVKSVEIRWGMYAPDVDQVELVSCQCKMLRM